MMDLNSLAARPEAICDITGKPIGSHMIDGRSQLTVAQRAAKWSAVLGLSVEKHEDGNVLPIRRKDTAE